MGRNCDKTPPTKSFFSKKAVLRQKYESPKISLFWPKLFLITFSRQGKLIFWKATHTNEFSYSHITASGEKNI
jgi:hypothetical protein